MHYGGLIRTVLVLTVLICSGFTTTASIGVLVIGLRSGAGYDAPFLWRLGVKGLVFGCAFAASGWVLRWGGRLPDARRPAELPPERVSWRAWLGLLAAAGAAMALVFPNLDRYPKAEPDEMHHLVVARNLAEYGLYASGHPAAGFELFDRYDSVGPPVIVPVAVSMRLGADQFVAARLTMAVYFVLLCLSVFFFCRPVFGAWAAVCSVFMVLMALMSVYLGRSVYGEAPAFLFAVVGLTFWRGALRAEKRAFWGVLAGAAFGLAVLCKPFLLMGVWAVAGALAFDRVSYRIVRLRHVLLPLFGYGLMVGCWWLVKAVFQHDAAQAAQTTLVEYQHNLVFGFASFVRTSGWIVGQPATLIGAVIALLLVLPVIFRHNYDPPTIVLFFAALFFTYWWLFFTTGLHGRYMWYTCAITQIFAGVLLAVSARQALDLAKPPRVRTVYAALACLVVVPALARTHREVKLIRGHDGMGDAIALAGFVRTLPEDTRIAALDWPLQRTLNFFAGRHVEVVKRVPTSSDEWDVLLADTRVQRALLEGREADRAFGDYGVLFLKGP